MFKIFLDIFISVLCSVNNRDYATFVNISFLNKIEKHYPTHLPNHEEKSRSLCLERFKGVLGQVIE